MAELSRVPRPAASPSPTSLSPTFPAPVLSPLVAMTLPSSVAVALAPAGPGATSKSLVVRPTAAARTFLVLLAARTFDLRWELNLVDPRQSHIRWIVYH